MRYDIESRSSNSTDSGTTSYDWKWCCFCDMADGMSPHFFKGLDDAEEE